MKTTPASQQLARTPLREGTVLFGHTPCGVHLGRRARGCGLVGSWGVGNGGAAMLVAYEAFLVWILGVGKRVGEGGGAERAVKKSRDHGGEPDQQSEWGGLLLCLYARLLGPPTSWT